VVGTLSHLNTVCESFQYFYVVPVMCVVSFTWPKVAHILLSLVLLQNNVYTCVYDYTVDQMMEKPGSWAL